MYIKRFVQSWKHRFVCAEPSKTVLFFFKLYALLGSKANFGTWDTDHTVQFTLYLM